MSDSVRPHPWDSPGKNTGVGCHFLLQCIKVNSESEVAQSCSTLRDPMDCSPPGSSVHGIFRARVLEWGAIAFSAFLPLVPCYFSLSLVSCLRGFVFCFFSLLFLPLVSCSASVSPETSPKQWPLGHLPGFPGGSAGKEFACNAGEPSSIPGSGRLCGEGNSYPFQYS